MAVEDWSDDVRVARLGDDPQFTDDLEQLLHEDEAAATDDRDVNRDVILDFGGVSFISSSNISDLLTLRKQQNQAGRKLICCGVDPAIISTLKVTGIDHMFTQVDNVPTALAAVKLT